MKGRIEEYMQKIKGRPFYWKKRSTAVILAGAFTTGPSFSLDLQEGIVELVITGINLNTTTRLSGGANLGRPTLELNSEHALILTAGAGEIITSNVFTDGTAPETERFLHFMNGKTVFDPPVRVRVTDGANFSTVFLGFTRLPPFGVDTSTDIIIYDGFDPLTIDYVFQIFGYYRYQTD